VYVSINKNFWQELINLLALHKPTANNLVTWVTMEHKNPNPLLRKAHLTTLNINKFKVIEAMGLKIIASRSP
jgi:hypothetical protein